MKAVSSVLLFFSIFTSISSSSVMLMWVFLEVSVFSFITLSIVLHGMNKNKEEMLKYFLIQSVASILILYSMQLAKSPLNQELVGTLGMSKMDLMLATAICIKLGVVPLHLWMVPVMKSLKWVIFYIILTWQKLIPIFLMVFMKLKIFLFFCSISLFVGTVSQMKISKLKMLLIFSSISHLSWIVISKGSIKTMSSYLILYFFIFLMVVIFLLSVSMEFIFKASMKSNMVVLIILLLSLSGIPPLLGFAQKWVVISFLSKLNLTLLILFFVLISCLGFYIYFRLSHYSLVSSSNSLKLINIMNIFPNKKMTMISSQMALPLMAFI